MRTSKQTTKAGTAQSNAGQHGHGDGDRNERFRLAWEMASDAMALSDPDGIVLAANPAYLRLYGFEAKQVIGQSFAIIFPEAVREWAIRLYKEYFESGFVPAALESTIERADGQRRIVETGAAFIVEDGRNTAMLSMIRDITDRKALENNLRSAQQETEQAAARIAALHAVTEAFSRVLTSAPVNEIILRRGLRAVGAVAGTVQHAAADGSRLALSAQEGYAPGWVAAWQDVPVEADTPLTEVVRTRSPLFFGTPEALRERWPAADFAPPYAAWAIVPLMVEARVLGVLGLSFDTPQAFGAEDRAYIQTLAGQCAQALERARLYEAEQQARLSLEARVAARTAELSRAKQALEAEIAGRQRLSQQLEQAREDERARLARELHDGLGGALTGLKMDLAQLRRGLPPDRPELEARLVDMLGLVDETVNVMRRIASDLRPAVLDDLGLVSALEWLVAEFSRRSGVACALATNCEAIELDPQRSIAVFRIAQEALTNILRHAAATQVNVRLDYAASTVGLVVADNGRGIAPERRTHGTTLGLAGMRERVRQLGGTLEIDSEVGQGTTVKAVIPTPA